MDEDLVATLVREMSLTMNDVYFMKGPLGIGDLFDLPVDFGLDTSLVFPHWAPMTHLRLAKVRRGADPARPSCGCPSEGGPLWC